MEIKTILATIVTAAIFTLAVIMSAVPTPQAYAQDHCTSSTGPFGVSTSCSVISVAKGGEAKAIQDCRSDPALVKCSGSQTGFGFYGNFFKPK